MMNLDHLRVFLVVAELEHITQAAAEVSLSQPAVSKIIRQLEQTTQQKLVERRGRRIALTRAGKLLHTYARRMDGLEREMEDALTALIDIETGELTLAATPTLGISFVPSIVARFRARYSCVKIHLKIQSSAAILEDLLDWRLDFGLTELYPITLPPDVAYETIVSDSLILVVAPNHPWNTLASVKMAALCEDALILPKPDSDLRALIEKPFTQQGLSMRPLLTIPDGEVIKQMVIKGIGATLLPASSVQAELLRGELLRIPVPKLDMRSDVHLLWRNEKHFSPVARAFRNVLHREVHVKGDVG